jgi:uncharacterized SAM-binding protein YcdF (DUF218 family)
MKGLAALLVIALIWVTGLLEFADRIARLTPADDPDKADGIVVLTGASDLRLKIATDLLEGGKGGRLLVSGVNRQATRGDIWALTGAAKPLFDCCVDLGFTAEDTVGNAREAADWARSMGYRSLILVTADYHMPRALLEFHGAASKLAITPFPVATPALDARRWYATSHGARRMILEYSKYLTILAREAVLKLAPAGSAAPLRPAPAS